jgi:hypothetical protein
MVDRLVRDGYAELLRHFAAGRVLNWRYEDSADAFIKSEDQAVVKVFWAVWPAYCDIRKHYLTGKDRLDANGRHVVARYLLFLYSNLEYEWPVEKRTRVWANFFTLGIWGWLDPLPPCRGDDKVWPFFRRSDLDREAARPRLLGNAR